MPQNFWLLPLLPPMSLSRWSEFFLPHRQLYHWLYDNRDRLGRCYCVLNLTWPSQQQMDDIPDDHDTYVLSFMYEYPDLNWVKEFCNRYPDRLVIMVSQVSWENHGMDNLRVLTQDFWAFTLDVWFKSNSMMTVDIETERDIRISALANRVDQARSYVNAYLDKTYPPSERVISWRGHLSQRKDFYFQRTGRPKLDSVIDYLEQVFFDKRILLDDFANSPWENLRLDIPAYQRCIVNCTNESIYRSWTVDQDGQGYIEPGIYFSEKTWKPLIAGTAVLPVGQTGTYDKLRSLGFEFDYPWSCAFDTIPQDLDRIESILHVLDDILHMSMDDLQNKTRDSCQYNHHWIVSGGYRDRARTQDQQAVAELLGTL